MKRILLISFGSSEFIEIDYKILKEKYQVERLILSSVSDFLKLSTYKILYNNTIYISWFSSWFTFIPLIYSKIFYRKFIVITGGYDSAKIKEFNYGSQLSFFKRNLTNFCIKNADIIICNSDFTKNETLQNCNLEDKDIIRIHHGLFNKEYSTIEKENIILNIGVLNQSNLFRKGILPFIQTANLINNYQFYQIGKNIDSSIEPILEKYKTTNLKILGFLNQNKLDDLLNKSKFYIQPSQHEGFGMSVIEAMQAGVIPIVSRHGALPEVIGKYGIILENETPNSIVESIKKAEKLYSSEFIINMKNFIQNEYSIQKRAQLFYQIIDRL